MELKQLKSPVNTLEKIISDNKKLMMKNKRGAFVLSIIALLLVGAVGAVIYKNLGIQKQSQKKEVDSISNNLSDENVEELSKIFDKINNSRNLYLQGNFDLTESSSGILIEKEPFILAKYEGSTYLMTGNVEQISFEGNVALLNNDTKTIISESVKNNTNRNSLSNIEALISIKNYIADLDSSKVFIQNKGTNKIIKIVIYNPQSLYRETEIEFDSTSQKLLKSSVVTSVIDNTNNENVEKKVQLTMSISIYNEDPNNSKPKQLNAKVRWKNNKLILIDSLKDYTINHTINK